MSAVVATEDVTDEFRGAGSSFLMTGHRGRGEHVECRVVTVPLSFEPQAFPSTRAAVDSREVCAQTGQLLTHLNGLHDLNPCPE